MEEIKDLLTTEEASQDIVDANTKYVEGEQEYSPEALAEMEEYLKNVGGEIPNE